MKKLIFTFLILTIGFQVKAQITDPLVSDCSLTAGPNTKYLKDFRIQLGKAEAGEELRYKSQISLWKNTKYRFTLCNARNSTGKLILSIVDETDKVILSSYDRKTGKTYPYVDFICNKSGVYKLHFDFHEGKEGSGIGIVSMVK